MKQSKEKAYRWLRSKAKGAKIVRQYLDKYGHKSQKAKDYLKAAKWLDYYFKLLDKSKDSAYAWLRGNSAGAKIVRQYFDKYAKTKTMSEHQEAYLAIKDVLLQYFDLPEDQRSAFLKAHPELRVYFDQYAEEGGMTQHALDYLAIKDVLDGYFALPEGEARRAYLDSNPVLRDYFAKYSKERQSGSGFRTTDRTYLAPGTYLGARMKRGRFLYRGRRGNFDIQISEETLLTENPDLKKRLEFWEIYYQLPPDERPAFVAEHAEEYGVFIYGFTSEEQTADRMAEWMRKAFILGVDSERSARYAYVKPLLDFYYELSAADRELFRRANPELDAYLDEFSDHPTTGDAELDSLIAEYFALPRGSRDRSILLDANPELQDWLDENSSAEDTALHDLLDQYFQQTSTAAKKEFALQHPEITSYFEKRREEKRLEREALEAFDRADPRLSPFFEAAEFEIYHAAWLRQRRALAEQARGILLEQDRERSGRRPLGVAGLAF